MLLQAQEVQKGHRWELEHALSRDIGALLEHAYLQHRGPFSQTLTQIQVPAVGSKLTAKSLDHGGCYLRGFHNDAIPRSEGWGDFLNSDEEWVVKWLRRVSMPGAN